MATEHYTQRLHPQMKAVLEKQAEVAEAFDAVHTVERARDVGSLESIVEPARTRAWLIERLEEELAGEPRG